MSCPFDATTLATTGWIGMLAGVTGELVPALEVPERLVAVTEKV